MTSFPDKMAFKAWFKTLRRSTTVPEKKKKLSRHFGGNSHSMERSRSRCHSASAGGVNAPDELDDQGSRVPSNVIAPSGSSSHDYIHDNVVPSLSLLLRRLAALAKLSPGVLHAVDSTREGAAQPAFATCASIKNLLLSGDGARISVATRLITQCVASVCVSLQVF